MAVDNLNEKVQLTGESRIDGALAERYTAIIDKMNPQNMVLTRSISNSQLRKDNKELCRADQAAFEDDAYVVQNEMIAEDSVKEEV